MSNLLRFSYRFVVAGSILLTNGCATSGTSSSTAKRADVPDDTKAEEVGGSKEVATDSVVVKAETPSAPKDVVAALNVDGTALVGAWQGTDARSIVGTLKLCQDNTVSIVVDGKALDAADFDQFTWAVKKVQTAHALLELSAQTSAGNDVMTFLVRRDSTTAITIARLKKGQPQTNFDGIAANDIVHLTRTTTSPTCQ